MTPSTPSFTLSRLAFGPDQASVADLNHLGLAGWVESQLRPNDAADPVLARRLTDLRLRIRYGEAKDWPATDEMRPLMWLDAPMDALSALNDPGKSLAGQEKQRPRIEVTAATLCRAVYSRWQLREVVCDFWHNHFNVNAWDHMVGLGLPVHDREVIRRHGLGNFRQLLEAVATSPSMLWFLNNRSSRAGAPNENFARELFELHTLGRDAYLNGLYNRWRDVPGALAGQPQGYVDQDVYEAARAFTGWGVEDGSGLGGGQSLSRSGRFVYVESWHDNYQKRVLATEFDPFQSAMADGRKVLDLAAYHPATAQFLCKKLCIRLVADQPPPDLIASAADVWLKTRDQPDQIAQVIAHIALSPAFAQSRGTKVKRPLELAASYLRATAIDFSPTEGLIGEMDAAGQKLFGWPTPTGHPDTADYWLSVNAMRRRWTLVAGLTENWWGTGAFDPFASVAVRGMPAERFLSEWSRPLFDTYPMQVVPAVLAAQNIAPGAAITDPGQARRLVAAMAMSPEFQTR